MAKRHAPGSIHEALDALMGEIEKKAGKNGYEVAADFENVTKFTLYKQVDPDNPAEMSFARVARLSAHFGVVSAIEYLADQVGYVVVPQCRVATDTNLASHMARVACESSQALQAMAEGIADQKYTKDELLRMKEELRDVRRASAAAELAVDAQLAGLDNVTAIRGAA